MARSELINLVKQCGVDLRNLAYVKPSNQDCKRVHEILFLLSRYPSEHMRLYAVYYKQERVP